DPVDDVLVDPVGGPGDRVLRAAGDAARVDVVEVVLVLEEPVAGPGEGVAPGDAVDPDAPPVPEVRGADAEGGDHRADQRDAQAEARVAEALDREVRALGLEEVLEPEGGALGHEAQRAAV